MSTPAASASNRTTMAIESLPTREMLTLIITQAFQQISILGTAKIPVGYKIISLKTLQQWHNSDIQYITSVSYRPSTGLSSTQAIKWTAVSWITFYINFIGAYIIITWMIMLISGTKGNLQFG